MGLYTYILKCSDESFYVGVTNNIEVRLQQHNSCMNRSCYTAKRVPVILAWTKHFESNMEAIAWEKKLKGWTKKKKQALIDQRFDLLHEYAKCKNWSASTPLRQAQDELLSVTSPSTPLRQAQDELFSVTSPSALLLHDQDKLLNIDSSSIIISDQDDSSSHTD